MPIAIACQRCSKEFTVGAKEAHRVFCSRECYHAERRDNPDGYVRLTPTHKTCVNCGTEFSQTNRNLNTKFCSASCRETYTAIHGRDGQRKALVCAHCSTEFTVSPKEVRNGRKYCSMTCYSAALSASGRPNNAVEAVHFECKECGTPFQRNPGELRAYHKAHGKDPLYCSRECSHIGRRHAGTKNCVVCDTPFEFSGHSTKRTATCSDACRRTLQRRNLLATNEAERPSESREITRQITAQGYVRLRFPNQNGVKGREVLEHRYVMEQHIGRELRPEETVHHRVKPTTNNELSNLELFSSRHGPGQRVIDRVADAIETLKLYPEFAPADWAEFIRSREGHATPSSLIS